jgi:hypothetical protein
VRSDASTAPPALVISKQVFATHYRTAALSLTAIIGHGASRYLVYVHRSRLDVLHGFLGGLMRRIVEARVRDEAPAVLDALRSRLEHGDPPAEVLGPVPGTRRRSSSETRVGTVVAPSPTDSQSPEVDRDEERSQD